MKKLLVAGLISGFVCLASAHAQVPDNQPCRPCEAQISTGTTSFPVEGGLFKANVTIPKGCGGILQLELFGVSSVNTTGTESGGMSRSVYEASIERNYTYQPWGGRTIKIMNTERLGSFRVVTHDYSTLPDGCVLPQTPLGIRTNKVISIPIKVNGARKFQFRTRSASLGHRG
jgi:hypothetical protein